ncbi:LAMI_0F01574g1_1 [Lachancea mirantina]|uniref:LAMI_0F01574g1_1 n=1 Tax=Lachancea mirantina TaxID=1230905 RepID=A0A1G4JW06_9SACH|nr:LAMI_0F01574g1_1 [Lachancea mirantina]
MVRDIKVKVREVYEYLAPYLVFHFLAASLLALFVYTEIWVDPRTANLDHGFDRNNSAILKSYIYPETVSALEVVLLAAMVPGVVVAWWCLIAEDSCRLRSFASASSHRLLEPRPKWISPKLHMVQVTYTALFLTLAIAGAATNILKLLIGNARPDFFARCFNNNGAPQIPADLASSSRITLGQCTQSSHRLLMEGLKSTPSGHASFVTAGLGFLFQWQCEWITVSRARHLWCPIVCLIVMISRVTDHRHHWYDVMAGCLLGLMCSWLPWVKLLSVKRLDTNATESELPL